MLKPCKPTPTWVSTSIMLAHTFIVSLPDHPRIPILSLYRGGWACVKKGHMYWPYYLKHDLIHARCQTKIGGRLLGFIQNELAEKAFTNLKTQPNLLLLSRISDLADTSQTLYVVWAREGWIHLTSQVCVCAMHHGPCIVVQQITRIHPSTHWSKTQPYELAPICAETRHKTRAWQCNKLHANFQDHVKKMKYPPSLFWCSNSQITYHAASSNILGQHT